MMKNMFKRLRDKYGMRRNVSWLATGVVPFGLLAVLLFSHTHFLDVRKSVAECGDIWLEKNYLVLTAVVLAILTAAGMFFVRGVRIRSRWRPFRLAQIYPVAILSLGLCYLAVLPPLSAPDEVSHYISAYQFSSRWLGRPANDKTGHVLVREEDMFLEDIDGVYSYQPDADGYLAVSEGQTDAARVLGQTLTEETYHLLHEQDSWFSERDAAAGNSYAVSIHHPVVTTPLIYLPQALGILLGRVLHLSGIGLLYLGRLFNLLSFVFMGWLAMRRLPFGKEVLFGVCLLPMSLHLAASLSYDAMIMAGIFLFTACCLSLAYEQEEVRWRDVLLLAVLMAVIGPCKMVYAVFMGLCLLIPVQKFGGRKQWWAAAVLVSGAWLLAMYVVNRQTIVSYAVATDSYVSWAGEAGYSLYWLLYHPDRLFRLFYNTIIWQAEYWHLTMLGAYLGNVDEILDVPYLLVLFFSAGLLMLAFLKPGDRIVRREREPGEYPSALTDRARLWIWVLCGGCAAALMLSMLIAWTPFSAQVIAGVQGRYFLPFLPVLLMTVKNELIVLTKNTDRSILYLMCCANGYALLRLFSIVTLRL